MLTVLSNSFVLFLMIGLGYLLKTRGILGPQHRKMLLTIILNVTMPCAIIMGFDTSLNIATLLWPFLLTCAACLSFNLAAIAFTRGMPGQTRALTLLMTCGYFVAPFTIPFVQANIGGAAIMLIAIYDAGQSFFNMGLNYLWASALVGGTREKRPSPGALLKNMFSSGVLLAYVAMLVLSALRISLPGIVLNFVGKVGGANLFLCMIFIGLVLEFRLEAATLRQLGRIFAIRYGGAILIAALCLFVLPLDTTAARMITLGLLSPISTASMAYAERFGCDPKVYGAASSISFAVSMLVFSALFLVWA